MKEYMIVLKGSFTEWNARSKEERSEIMKRYGHWAQKLAADKILKGGSELTSTVKRIRNLNGINTVDGPFPESKEALTGFFVITAENIDVAVKIAHGCPALTHGEAVEVYEKPGDCEV